MGRAWDPLRIAHQQFVVDPSMFWVELVGMLIVGRNDNIIRTGHVFEVLHAPRIALNYGHIVLLKNLCRVHAKGAGGQHSSTPRGNSESPLPRAHEIKLCRHDVDSATD